MYVGRPCKNASSEAVAVFYEIVYRLLSVIRNGSNSNPDPRAMQRIVQRPTISHWEEKVRKRHEEHAPLTEQKNDGFDELTGQVVSAKC